MGSAFNTSSFLTSTNRRQSMSEVHPNKGKGVEKWAKEHDVSC